MQLSPDSVFITGADNSLGLGLVRGFCQLSSPPKFIFATCRDVEKAEDLKALGTKYNCIHIKELDVTDYTSLPRAVNEVDQIVQDHGLTILINSAGFTEKENQALSDVSAESLREQLEINTISPLIIAQHFEPLLIRAAARHRSKRMSCSQAAIINISSRLGSISENDSGGKYPQRISKAGLNMITKSLSVDLKKSGILVASIHPGWPQDRSTQDNTDDCARHILDVMEGLDQNMTGTFWHMNGQALKW